MNGHMTTIEAEWVVAWALVSSGLMPARKVARESLINVGREVLMKRCSKCGREYYADCIDCTFRNGGKIQDSEKRELDLCEQMSSLITDARYRLENALQWMGVQTP